MEFTKITFGDIRIRGHSGTEHTGDMRSIRTRIDACSRMPQKIEKAAYRQSHARCVRSLRYGWRTGDAAAHRFGPCRAKDGGERKAEGDKWTSALRPRTGPWVVLVKDQGGWNRHRSLRIASIRACTSSQVGIGPKQRALHCFANSTTRTARSSGGGKRASLCAKV